MTPKEGWLREGGRGGDQGHDNKRAREGREGRPTFHDALLNDSSTGAITLCQVPSKKITRYCLHCA